MNPAFFKADEHIYGSFLENKIKEIAGLFFSHGV
jgi:hypothetical protein